MSENFVESEHIQLMSMSFKIYQNWFSYLSMKALREYKNHSTQMNILRTHTNPLRFIKHKQKVSPSCLILFSSLFFHLFIKQPDAAKILQTYKIWFLSYYENDYGTGSGSQRFYPLLNISCYSQNKKHHILETLTFLNIKHIALRTAKTP